MPLKRPTPNEILAEIARLREMKPSVRHYSAFNDDHWEAIDAQIRVLEEGMDMDTAIAEFDPDEEKVGTSLMDSIEEAVNWLEAEATDKPSDGWKELVQ